MKKCPRCEHEIEDKEKYCPYCGLDLQGRYRPIQKKKPFARFMPLIIFFSFMMIPILYNQFLNQLSDGFISSNGKQIELGEVKDHAPTSVLDVYTTLADFKNTFSNTDSLIKKIENYESELNKKANHVFDKKYEIVLLDNNNVYFTLTYTSQIDEKLSIRVERAFDRINKLDEEVITFQKNGAKDFEDLFLDEEELQLVKKYTGQQDVTDKLIQDFSHREDEFEKKKEKLGHYGIGNYNGESSFVAHRKGKEYYSKLTYAK